MFQSFTGSSRRPRQVNLSGRNTNPFGSSSPSARQGPHGHGSQNTLAIAQQERLIRQQERDRLKAARTVQQTWRGYRSRGATRRIWRAEWDDIEQKRIGHVIVFDDHGVDQEGETVPTIRYSTLGECLSQLRLLLHFLEISKDGDAARLVYFSKVFRETLEEVSTMSTDGEWTTLLIRLAKMTLRLLQALSAPSRLSNHAGAPLLQLLRFLTRLLPRQMAHIAKDYYSAMGVLTTDISSLSPKLDYTLSDLVAAVLALLRPLTADTLGAYEWFSRQYLTIPNLPSYLRSLDELASNINYRLLAKSLDSCVADITVNGPTAEEVDARLWLLSYFIYFRRYAVSGTTSQEAPEPEFVKVVSALLNSVAVYVSRRLEPDDFSESGRDQDSQLPIFVQEQLCILVNQNSITGLLSKVRSNALNNSTSASENISADEAKILASYALTLLRVFPRRGDDIRMWLYLGSASSVEPKLTQSTLRVPAIKYFWQASRRTEVLSRISRDSNEVLPLLKPIPPAEVNRGRASTNTSHDRDKEWTIILLFLELYTFVLKVMDDDEFFSGESLSTFPDTRVSWTKESALPLKDVRDMTIFLKNLAFTLYWNAADLNEAQNAQDTSNIRNYFTASATRADTMTTIRELEQKNKEKGLPGVTGIPLDYFKGLVTGLLRMIHERE
jgi:ubiquitin-protein ligase E3 C